MSLYGSDKEYYLCLSIKFNRRQLEQVLNIMMKDEIELEMNLKGRKVDFYSLLEDGRPLYMELQLGKADETHSKQVKHIINNVDSGDYVLVWIASEHNEEFLQEIYKMIDSSNKSICFFALCINSDLIPYLDIINKLQMKDIVKSLTILDNIQKHFSFYAMYYREAYKQRFICESGRQGIIECELSYKQNVLKMILLMLRKEIYYFPSIHRSKKMEGNVISMGSGREGITFLIGYNRRNQIYVELRFTENNWEIYEEMLDIKEDILDAFDYMVEFNTGERKVGSYYYFEQNKRDLKLNQLVRMVKKYVDYFSPYFYSRPAEGM